MKLLEPVYTTVDSVRIRLSGKVNFQDDPKAPLEQGQLSEQLFRQLIRDGETRVEQDLRGRYAIPLQSKRTKKFVDLPDSTQRALRTIIDWMAVMMVLTTDFGAGTHLNGEEYSAKIEEFYEPYIDRLLGQDREAANTKASGQELKRYRKVLPLEDLLLCAGNTEADDGGRGMFINTDSSRNDAVTYAEEHINNPSRTYIGVGPGRGGVQ